MVRIRPATVHDTPLLCAMIRELAEFEQELDSVTIQAEDLARDGFGPDPKFRALIAECDDQPAGYALFFPYFSTWVGRGLYLEDLFVRASFRGRKIGTALLAAVARVAIEEQCEGVHWEVLAWNEKAIKLYRDMGAEFPDQWRRVRLSDQALRRLAEKAL